MIYSKAFWRGALERALKTFCQSLLAVLGVGGLEGQVAGLTAALQSMAAGQGVDLAAVEAAAKRGVEQGLAGATVTVELGPA